MTRLASAEFDLLVIGGGIHGLTAAYDAAQRGLSVALVERGDFGGATSFNHLKTIHGGLRYLQTADFARMRESIRERRAFARIAPRFVAPLAFVTPTSSSLTRNAAAMKAAFALDAIVGSDRNNDLPPSHHLPPGRLVSSDECRALVGADGEPVMRGGALWYDYETVQGDRLTLAFALAADARGAALANYVEAAGALMSGRTITGIKARDVFTNNTFDIRARAFVVAAGPWTSTFLSHAGVRRSWPLMKVMNLVTSRPARRAALAMPAKSGRALIMLPWQGRTLVGTGESTVEQPADAQQARRPEVSAFLAEINETFPGFNLDADEVTLVHRGIVPAVAAAKTAGGLSLLGHSKVCDHSADGVANLVSVVGVKYTTARAVAEQVTDLVFAKLGRPAVRCRTTETLLPTAGQSDAASANPIQQAVEVEMAHTLADVVVRRTGIGAAGYPGDGAVHDHARTMKQLCGWSIERTSSEIAALKRFYDVE